MELVEGKALSEIIDDYAPMDFRDTIRIGMQVASALKEAHKNHIIHRDVKPHNILITDDGIAKITDFGIARAVTDSKEQQNESDVIMGSVHYFSPEQGRGQFVDEKSDIYSLGIVLYEMLTGRVPFDADTPIAIAVMHMNDPIVPPSKIVGGVPPGLEQIILKATEKYQVNRFKTVGEMYEALANVDFVTGKISDPDMERYIRATLVPPVYGAEEEPFEDDAEYAGAENSDGDELERYDDYDDGTYADSDDYNPDDDNAGYYDDAAADAEFAAGGAAIYEGDADDEDDEDDFVGGRKGKRRRNKRKNKERDPKIRKMKVFAILAAILLSLALCYPIFLGMDWVLSEHGEKVPQLVGLTLTDAKELAKEKGFTLEIEDKEYSDKYKSGYIILQDPGKGHRLSKGETIKVIVSKGAKKKAEVVATAPDLLGKSKESAEYTIQQYGYVVGSVTYIDSDKPADTVIDQDPKGGTKLEKGSAINIYLSNGAKKSEVSVPMLIGMTENQALLALQDLGLYAGSIIRQYSNDAVAGMVIGQGVSAGTQLEQGSAVNIIVSLGPQPAPPPPVTPPVTTPDPIDPPDPGISDPAITSPGGTGGGV
jgi:serine/threonine-protein kinase